MNDITTTFYEGTEKLLEIWFEPLSDHALGHKWLRAISRSQWVEVLKVVNCEIVNGISGTEMDSYLLSESSMFVTDIRLIVKTCGRTTLLLALDPILTLVGLTCQLKVKDIFYSRKSFSRPDEQKPPHQRFEDEAKFLDDHFEDGVAYSLGRVNGDMWYVYTLNNVPNPIGTPDQTLEILMTEPDPSRMRIFTKSVCPTTELMVEQSGVQEILPGVILDATAFDPCGFSANAIIEGETYYNIHVTPQPSCSYVSFETNITNESYVDLVNKVISLFQPLRYTITLFANKHARCGLSRTALNEVQVKGYKSSCYQFCEFGVYNLSLGIFKKITAE